MGKITRGRRKFHSSRAIHEATRDSTANANVVVTSVTGIESEVPILGTSTVPMICTPTENIFAGINITNAVLQQKLTDVKITSIELDEVDPIATRDRPLRDHKGKKIAYQTKIEKRQLRHEAFLNKLHGTRQAEQADKARKKRQKTAITGDLHPLLESLPDPLQQQKPAKPPLKKRSIPKSKKRQQAMMDDLLWMMQATKKP